MDGQEDTNKMKTEMKKRSKIKYLDDDDDNNDVDDDNDFDDFDDDGDKNNDTFISTIRMILIRTRRARHNNNHQL